VGSGGSVEVRQCRSNEAHAPTLLAEFFGYSWQRETKMKRL